MWVMIICTSFDRTDPYVVCYQIIVIGLFFFGVKTIIKQMDEKIWALLCCVAGFLSKCKWFFSITAKISGERERERERERETNTEHALEQDNWLSCVDLG